MSVSTTPRPKLKTIGFGYAPEYEAHHFVVALSRSPTAEVLIYEVFEFDLAGPQLDAANLRCKLNAARWLKIVDAIEEEVNARLREAGMKPSRFRPGDNPLARLLGKEVVLLAWAIEDADPSLTPVAIQNWRGLAPEERWWLYTMTAAQTAHHSKHNVGWRKAIRFALTENPVSAPYLGATAAEHRRRARVGAFEDTQGRLFTGEDQAARNGIGIWEEACELPQRDTQTPPSPSQIQPSFADRDHVLRVFVGVAVLLGWRRSHHEQARGGGWYGRGRWY